MKSLFLRALASFAALAMIPALAQADNHFTAHNDYVENLGGDDEVQKDGPCYEDECRGGWLSRFADGGYVDIELNFMQYGKEGGVTNGVGTDGGFEYELTPRITLGFQNEGGMGVRVRAWDYSHTANSNGSVADDIQVDAFVFDVEVFETIDLNCVTTLEWSGGVRYTDFTESLGVMAGPRTPLNTEGFGGVIGAQLNRCVGRGAFYGRARAAMMLAHDGNRPGFGNTQYDLWTNQTEIAIGYETVRELNSGRLLRLRVGYEWQDWEGFSNRGAVNGANNDVGFAGFVLGAGLEF